MDSGLEAENKDPKELAKSMLKGGSSIPEIIEATGLSRPSVLGLKGVLAKAAKRAASRGEESSGEALPEEAEVLEGLLNDHGVKRKKAIADLMAYRSWDDYSALQEYLELSGVRVDRQRLILEAWSQHRGTRIPVGLIEGLRRVDVHGSQQGGEYLTKPDLDAYFIKKEEDQRLARIEGTLRSLVEGNPEKKSDEVKRLETKFDSLEEYLRSTEKSNLERRLSKVENMSTSDLQTAIVETGKVFTRLGDRAETIIMASQGFVENNVPPIQEPDVEAGQGIREELKRHGLVTVIRERRTVE